MMRLNRRVRQVESRLALSTGQAADRQEAMLMIVANPRDRDDPHGFGLRLDERLASDEPDRS
jgi:hypothetical protein